MKILVTGASGFIGSHVADALSNNGHDVTLFDQTPSLHIRDDQTMFVGDVLDEDAVEKACKGQDAIYHFAAIADIDEAIHLPKKTLEVNCIGTVNFLEQARINDIKRFVFASSIYVYSSQGSFYRISKQASELLIQDYNERFGLPYTILRYGSLYGPRAERSNAVYRMLKQALNEGYIEYKGSGHEVREYIHADDAANASVEILDPEFEDEIIHLTGRERLTTGDMMEMIKEILGGKIDVRTSAETMTGHYVQTPYSYTPKIGRKLVRNTYIDLGLGLLDCIETIDHSHNKDAQ